MPGSLLNISYDLFSQWLYEVGTIIRPMLNLPKIIELADHGPEPRGKQSGSRVCSLLCLRGAPDYRGQESNSDTDGAGP